MFVVTHSGCAYSPTRKVGYGGDKWSLADVFPAGPNRELAAAAASGDLAGIDRALKAGADVNFRGANGFTPLWWSAWDQNLKGFTRLLEVTVRLLATPVQSPAHSQVIQIVIHLEILEPSTCHPTDIASFPVAAYCLVAEVALP